MGDYSGESFQVDDLLSKILRLKNLNNNSQKANCCELSGCHAMKPCGALCKDQQSSDSLDSIKEVLNENSPSGRIKTETTTNHLHDEGDNHESTSSNSTGNLSISQYEYGDDDEVIFLANQQFVDDDVSEQSDDCVYAYRGADFDIEYRNNNNIDDETDYLEMDFEPDPASEIENATNECVDGERSFNPDLSADKLLLIQVVDDTSALHQIRTSFNSNHVPKSINGDDRRSHAKTQNNISEVNNVDESTGNFKFTGAKPKRQLPDKSSNTIVKPSSPRKQLQGSTNEVQMVTLNAPECINWYNVGSDLDETCIDCLEKEFLLTTVGRKIETTYCKKCSRVTINGQERHNFNASDYVGDLNFKNPFVASKLETIEMKFPNVETFSPNQNEDNLLLKRTCKETVTFSSVNIDEKVIIQALDHINVNFNKDTIKKYFENENIIQRRFHNITELILYYSKKNCDYKRIIKLIKLACNGEVQIKFTRDENVSKETEIVQVRSCDILEMWTIQQHNLERLKRLNSKFIQMNVLGKVINLIRHAQQRNTKPIEEYIKVPQYYKTGYICITKN